MSRRLYDKIRISTDIDISSLSTSLNMSSIIYYVRETERGMMAADSELTKQLSSHTLLKNSIKFK